MPLVEGDGANAQRGHKALALTPTGLAGLLAAALFIAPLVTHPAAGAAPRQKGAGPRPSLTDIPDLSKAVPAASFATLPSSEVRYRALAGEVEKVRPRLKTAKITSARLTAEADSLRQKLILTASRVQQLEAQKAQLGQRIAALSLRRQQLAARFGRERVQVTRLLALLERLQHDAPPVLAISASDALVSARQAMLLGASLPRLYGAAAALARQLELLRRTQAELIRRRTQSMATSRALHEARARLDQLLATKQGEADTAAARYATLAAKYAVIARQAEDLGQLLNKVALLRAAARRDPAKASAGPHLTFVPRRGALAWPVVGEMVRGAMPGAGVGGTQAPGLSFLSAAGAEVVAPADGRVLFAGPYQRTGQVLILELGDGYDLVLAGLGKVSVRVGDGVLMGEPLGTMPKGREHDPLYIELRHGLRALSPLPWLESGFRKAKKS